MSWGAGVKVSPGHRHGHAVQEEYPLSRRAFLPILGHHYAALHLCHDVRNNHEGTNDRVRFVVYFLSHETNTNERAIKYDENRHPMIVGRAAMTQVVQLDIPLYCPHDRPRRRPTVERGGRSKVVRTTDGRSSPARKQNRHKQSATTIIYYSNYI